MNENPSPAGAGTSQSPLVQPAAPAPQTPEQKAKQKKGAIGAIVAILVGVALIITFNVISKRSAQKALDYVVDVCEEHGLYSTECTEAQKEKDVTCTITGCTKKYTTYY